MTPLSKERDMLSVTRMALSPLGKILSVSATLPLIKLFGDTQTAWIVQPIAIAIITESSGRRTFGPFCTTTGKRRQKTPIGARRIIMAMIL